MTFIAELKIMLRLNFGFNFKKVLGLWNSKTNDKIYKGALNHVVKWLNLAKWLNILLQTKWLWV